MNPSKKNRGRANLKRRAAIDTILLILVILAMVFMKRYHPAPQPKPGQTTPSIKNTLRDAKQPVSSQSPSGKELSSARTHELQEEDRRFLIAKGLKQPVQDLVQDLMNHNELIPCKGTVGGTPGFYDRDRIAVLSRDRVMADYNDGHVEGTIELSYTVSQGTVSWSVVHSECGE